MKCLLDRVRRREEQNNHEIGDDDDDDDDDKVSYEQWLLSLSERICDVWSTQLGHGQKGTDAYEDEHAWLCLARTATSLVSVEDSSCGDMKDDDNSERKTTSSLKDFQLSLSRCILKRAFDDDQDGKQPQDTEENREKTEHHIGNNNDWVPGFVDEEMQSLKIPAEARSYQSWQAMTLATVGLAKLAASFPEDEATKCFALMDICTVCFRLGYVELQPKIRNQCLLKEKKEEDYIEYDDVQITKDTTTTSSISIEGEILEKQALYNAFERLESVTQILSNKTRALIMQNVCFPWASHMAESLRNYVRLQKGPFAPPSLKKNVIAPMQQQPTLDTFLSSNKPIAKCLQKGPLAPPSLTDVIAPMKQQTTDVIAPMKKQQTTLTTFFSSNKPITK